MADDDKSQDLPKAPRGLSYQAQMFHAIFKQAWKMFDAGQIEESRNMCLELIQEPYLPRAIRCSAYHQLACCPPDSQTKYWLDLAANLCDEMDEIEKTPGTAMLRRKTEEYRQALLPAKGDEGDDDDTESLLGVHHTGTKLPLRGPPSTAFPTPRPSSQPGSPKDEGPKDEGPKDTGMSDI